MTNPKRGELRINLNDEIFDVKINMDTIMRIETATGKGILKIANGLQEADMSALEMVSILTPVLRTSGKDLKDKDVANLIWEAGFADGLRVIAEVIAFIISGGDEGNVAKAVNG